jgi:hypothetical protein
MSFFTSLLQDLRERQVLPAVLLLIVLAIAVPVGASIALSKSSAPTLIPVPAVSSTAPKGVLDPTQELAAVSSAPVQRAKVFKGKEPNPFRSKSVSTGGGSTKTTTTTTPSTTTTTPSTTTTTTTTPTKTTTPSTTTTTTTTHPKTMPTPTPTPAPAKLGSDEVYTANLTTTYGSQKDSLDDVQRLTPLPANSAPELVFLGVLKGGKKAVFLLTSAVATTLMASHSASCVPSMMACQILELEVGNTIKLDPANGTTGVSKFSLKLTRLSVSKKSSSSEATGARNSASVAGQQILATSTLTSLSDFFYDVGLGSLVYHKPAPTSGSTGTSGTTAATGATGTT